MSFPNALQARQPEHETGRLQQDPLTGYCGDGGDIHRTIETLRWLQDVRSGIWSGERESVAAREGEEEGRTGEVGRPGWLESREPLPLHRFAPTVHETTRSQPSDEHWVDG